MRLLNAENVNIYCNMHNMFIIAGVISIIFFIGKFLEMRYVEKESKPLKFLIRDSLLVYVSVVFGLFIINQLNPVIQETNLLENPVAFTDNPPF
jgi:hypothetical protein